MKNLRYIFSLLPGFLAILANVLGGNFIYLNLLYIFFMLVVSDWLFKENRENEDESHSDRIPDLILFCSSILHITAIATLLIGTYTHQLSGKFLYLAAISTGVNSGILGIISAHELIHRKLSSSRFLGILNLILVNYGHFYVEHVKGHHKWVGTSKDPATARRGESIYAFYFRTIPGQFLSA
jgi:alkane 1-monooxygenase